MISTKQVLYSIIYLWLYYFILCYLFISYLLSTYYIASTPCQSLWGPQNREGKVFVFRELPVRPGEQWNSHTLSHELRLKWHRDEQGEDVAGTWGNVASWEMCNPIWVWRRRQIDHPSSTLLPMDSYSISLPRVFPNILFQWIFPSLPLRVWWYLESVLFFC